MLMLILLVFTSLILFVKGTWDNVHDYTPSWVDEKIFTMIIYLFLLCVAASWVSILSTGTNFERYAVGNLYLLSVILFYFVLFSMSQDEFNSTELIVLASLVLTFLTLTLLSRRLLTVVPFLLYVYLFSIIYEIKNNSE